jgi:hypothetical protein
VAGLVVVSLATAGCGGNGTRPTGASSPPSTALVTVSVTPPHTLLFSISGSGTIATLVYTVDGQATTASSIPAPWQVSVPIPAGDGPSSWTLAYTGSGSLTDTVSLARQSRTGAAKAVATSTPAGRSTPDAVSG